MDVVNQVIDDLKREAGKPSCWNFMCEVSWGEFQDILGEGQDENRPFLVFTANDLKKILRTYFDAMGHLKSWIPRTMPRNEDASIERPQKAGAKKKKFLSMALGRPCGVGFNRKMIATCDGRLYKLIFNYVFFFF